MPDTFALTIIFVVLAAAVAAFVKGRSIDKCLRDFAGSGVTLEMKDGKKIWGRLRVESTGVELAYAKPHEDKDGHLERSFILYKHEYPAVQALVRYHDELDEAGREARERELRKTRRPGIWRMSLRRMHNLFNTVRDSVMEALTLVMGRAKQGMPGAAIISSQDKYVSRMEKSLIGLIGTSFEPLLERHIGKQVVLELARADKPYEYAGALKDYTAEFIEVVDVDYNPPDAEGPRRADLVVPRTCGIVRHLG